MTSETQALLERLWAYSVPNSGSRDGQEFLDMIGERLVAVEAQNEAMAEALRAIAEGNLGDAKWQADYSRISHFARTALNLEGK